LVRFICYFNVSYFIFIYFSISFLDPQFVGSSVDEEFELESESDGEEENGSDSDHFTVSKSRSKARPPTKRRKGSTAKQMPEIELPAGFEFFFIIVIFNV